MARVAAPLLVSFRTPGRVRRAACVGGPLRILYFINEAMPTHRVDVASLFGKYLPRLGVQSDLVAMTLGPEPVSWGGGRVIGCPEPTSRIGRHVAKLLHDLRHLGAARRYDLLMVRDKPVFVLLALLWARFAGVRFAYWMSYPFPEEWLAFARERGLSLGVLRWAVVALRGRLSAFILYRIVLPQADHVFLQSDAMLRDLQARGVRMKRPVAVPMGVDLELLEASRPVLTPEQAQWHGRVEAAEGIVYFGLLDRSRRVDVLVRAFAQVAAQRPRALLLLCGDSYEPGDAEELRRLAVSLGLADRVIFTGWLGVDVVWELGRAARLAWSVLPRGPIFDVASPTKAVEYLALGLPVVANDQPDQAWVLAESGGGRCTGETPDEVAAASLELLADAEQAAAMGAAGRRWVLAQRSYRQLAQLVHDALALSKEPARAAAPPLV